VEFSHMMISCNCPSSYILGSILVIDGNSPIFKLVDPYKTVVVIVDDSDVGAHIVKQLVPKQSILCVFYDCHVGDFSARINQACLVLCFILLRLRHS
jgi:hypothetical protein